MDSMGFPDDSFLSLGDRPILDNMFPPLTAPMQATVGSTPESTMKKVREVIASYNRHDLGPLMAIRDPDFVAYDPLLPEPIKGRKTDRKTHEGTFQAFPDLHMECLSLAVRAVMF